jgi:putative flippase GtrA
MIGWHRFARFNAVGALGIGVQLATLWTLVETANLPVIVATVMAVGAAILHNFVWHLRWTWRDRRLSIAQAPAALAKFVAANGLVSLAGNAAIMAVLVTGAGWPPVPANLVAIAACGLTNYWLGDTVVFAG